MDLLVAPVDTLHLVEADVLVRQEDVAVVVAEDFLCVSRNGGVAEAVVDAAVKVHVEEMYDGLSRQMLEADVVKYDPVMFVLVEVLEVVNMAHHKWVLEVG